MFFSGDRPKKFSEDLFFFWRALALVFLVLGLERSCPWPLECLSSVGLSLALEFLCPWPWPRALCPRLHLCLSHVGPGLVRKSLTTVLSIKYSDALQKKRKQQH